MPDTTEPFTTSAALTIPPPALKICDDGSGIHVWAEPFTDGDTCCCGRFYLTLHPPFGFAARLTETPAETV